MSRIELLGSENQAALEAIFKSGRQTVLIQSCNFSDIRLARSLIKQLINQAKFEVFIIEPDKTDKIKIEQIRELLEHTIITPKTRRYFLIFQADAMLAGAQNALLKELEEPSRKYFFYLFTNRPDQLLPTIRSRTNKINLLSIPLATITTYFKKNNPQLTAEQIKQINFIANDDLDLWQKLINKPNIFKKFSELALDAKKIIASRRLYDKLVILNQYSKDRQAAIDLVKLILRIYQYSLDKQISHQMIKSTQNWIKALDSLEQNASVRLALAKAVI